MQQIRSDLQFINHYINVFKRSWGSYLFFFLGINLFIEAIIIPIFIFLTSWILKLSHIPYVSYTNILEIITHHPVGSLALILELVLIVGVIFFQFTFLLTGITNISRDNFSLKEVWFASWRRLIQLRPTSVLFFIGYFILIIPFANLIFKTPLLNKAKIPAFIIDFLLTKWQFVLLLAIAYLIIFYLGLRLLYTLPLMIIQNYHTREAVSKSFSLTRHQNLANLRRMLVISIYFGIISAVGYLLIIFLQAGFDKFPKPFDLIMAIIMLAIIQIFSTFIATLVSFLLLQMTLPTEVFKGHPTFYHTNRINQRKKKIRVTTIVLISFIALLSLTNNYFYLHNNDTPPLRISHRGVDDGNGVQNTIPAMAATIKEHPDFIEMDIHETKDHQFVVMHDENLKNLTGVNKAPYQLTLAQITKLIAHENGHSAHVVSFDDYLAYANKHHQKLLIEIKTTPHDSKNMIDIFLKKYQKDILKYHHEVHSLDYNVVRQIKSKAPEVFVSYILPYNFTYPQTSANAYSMEQSTLNDSFIVDSLFNQQKVYAWTVNTDSEMDRILWLNTDGIITDNLSALDSKINDFYHDPSYADMLFNYITVIPYSNSITSEASV